VAYKTKKAASTVTLSTPVNGLPAGKDTILTITSATQTTNYLKVIFQNDFGEKLKDQYAVDGIRLEFLLTSVFDTDSLKRVLDCEDYSTVAGKKLRADVIEVRQHEIVENKRDGSVLLVDAQDNLIKKFEAYDHAHQYALDNKLKLSYHKITNHRPVTTEVHIEGKEVVETVTSTGSCLPASRRF